jgi:tetratricopeptide (TPR) repeat protein
MTSKNHPGGFWTASPDMLHLVMEDWPYHGAGQPGALGASTPQYGKYVLFRDGRVAFMTEETSRRGTGLVPPSAAPAGPAAATPSGPAVTPSGSSVAARGIYETASAALLHDRADEAASVFSQVVAEHPTTIEARKARLMLAWMKEDAGDFAAAEAHHQALIAAAPDTPQAAEAVAHIVLLRLRQLDQAGARAQLEAVVAARPGTEAAARARYGLGDLDWIARNYDAAEAQWQRVSTDYPASRTSWEAQVHLAQIHLEGAWLAYQQGDWQKTIRYAAPALTDPGMAVVRARFHLTVLEMLAYSQKNLGHYAEAISYLQQIVDHHPFHVVAAFAQLNIGDCYAALGDYALARAAYQALLEKDPDGPQKTHALRRLQKFP